MISEYQNTPENDATVQALPDPKHVWYDGQTIRVYTGEDIPITPPEVVTVSATKFFRALLALNIYDAAETMAQNTTDTEIKVLFARSSEFSSNDPALLRGAALLGMSEVQVLDVLRYASGLSS